MKKNTGLIKARLKAEFKGTDTAKYAFTVDRDYTVKVVDGGYSILTDNIEIINVDTTTFENHFELSR